MFMGKQLKLQVLPRNCLLAFGSAISTGAYGFWLSAVAFADLQGLLGAIGGIFLSCADVSVSSGAFEHALGLSNMQGNFKIATFLILQLWPFSQPITWQENAFRKIPDCLAHF